MSMSRNERRKARRERLRQKSERIAHASEAARLDGIRETVKANKLSPPSRDERISAHALRGPLAKMIGKPHLAKEMAVNGAPYRAMAMRRWSGGFAKADLPSRSWPVKER